MQESFIITVCKNTGTLEENQHHGHLIFLQGIKKYHYTDKWLTMANKFLRSELILVKLLGMLHERVQRKLKFIETL